MHTLASDLIVIWTAAVFLSLVFMFGGALSMDTNETYITTYGSIALIVIGATAVTIGQLVGWIGVW